MLVRNELAAIFKITNCLTVRLTVACSNAICHQECNFIVLLHPQGFISVINTSELLQHHF